MIQIIHGQVESSKLEPSSFDACFCDPPYLISFLDKSWDNEALSHTTWTKHIFAALKPGALLLAFSAPRSMHHLMIALEAAGFEIRDTLMWIYSTGYPKGIASLKPAYEPIILARKPFRGSLKKNDFLGALNIEACRVLRSEDEKQSGWSKSGSKESANGSMSGKNYARDPKKDNQGRWPANIIFDSEAALELDSKNEKTTSSKYPKTVKAKGAILPFSMRTAGGYEDSGGVSRFFKAIERIESGSISDGISLLEGNQDAIDRIYYCPKAKGKEREGNSHPTVKPIRLTEYLSRLILPPYNKASKKKKPSLLVPFSGSGSEMLGAMNAGWTNVTGIEQDKEYIAIARRRLGI